MNRWIILSLASALAAFGTYVTKPSAPFVDPPVNLQATSPGTAQTGHINVSGNVLAKTFSASANGQTAVSGINSAVSGTQTGGFFVSAANNGRGIFGSGTSTTGFNYGGYFDSSSDNGKGVFGNALSATGTTYGVHGRAGSTAGRGVFGESTATTGTAYGMYGRAASTGGRGVFGEAVSASGANYGGFFQSASVAGFGLYAKNTAGGVGLRAESSGNALQVLGASSFTGTATFSNGTPFAVSSSNLVSNLNADLLDGKHASSFLQAIPMPLVLSGSDTGPVLDTENTFDGINAYAIRATQNTANGRALTAIAQGASGIGAEIYGGTQGVFATSGQSTGIGVFGFASAGAGANYGVQGTTSSPFSGFGVYSFGNMGATGNKPFRIDHPLDPENKYLLHYSSESPLPENFYNGNVVTDANGEAWVQLPDYFEEINKDFRYTLTVVDGADTDVFVMAKIARKIKDNRFKIRTNAPHVEVSWEVKALRNDRWERKYPPKTEVEKVGRERGLYQHPELYDKPKEMGINFKLTHGSMGGAAPAKK